MFADVAWFDIDLISAAFFSCMRMLLGLLLTMVQCQISEADMELELSARFTRPSLSHIYSS